MEILLPVVGVNCVVGVAYPYEVSLATGGVSLSVAVGAVRAAAVDTVFPDGGVRWVALLEGVEVPFTSFYLRMKADSDDYLRITCPLVAEVVSILEINPSANIVLQQVTSVGGIDVFKTMSSVACDGVFDSAGSRNKSVNIEGHGAGTVGVNTVELKNLTFRGSSRGGVRLRMVPQAMIYPMDVFVEAGASVAYTVNSVTYHANTGTDTVNYFMEAEVL